MEEQQTELDFDLGEGKMGLERAPAVTRVLFSPLHFCRLSRFRHYLGPRTRINTRGHRWPRDTSAQGASQLSFSPVLLGEFGWRRSEGSRGVSGWVQVLEHCQTQYYPPGGKKK